MKRKRIKWKAALSTVLTAAMLLSVVPAGAVHAEEGSTATGRDLLGMTLA